MKKIIAATLLAMTIAAPAVAGGIAPVVFGLVPRDPIQSDVDHGKGWGINQRGEKQLPLSCAIQGRPFSERRGRRQRIPTKSMAQRKTMAPPSICSRMYNGRHGKRKTTSMSNRTKSIATR